MADTSGRPPDKPPIRLKTLDAHLGELARVMDASATEANRHSDWPHGPAYLRIRDRAQRYRAQSTGAPETSEAAVREPSSGLLGPIQPPESLAEHDPAEINYNHDKARSWAPAGDAPGKADDAVPPMNSSHPSHHSITPASALLGELPVNDYVPPQARENRTEALQAASPPSQPLSSHTPKPSGDALVPADTAGLRPPSVSSPIAHHHIPVRVATASQAALPGIPTSRIQRPPAAPSAESPRSGAPSSVRSESGNTESKERKDPRLRDQALNSSSTKAAGAQPSTATVPEPAQPLAKVAKQGPRPRTRSPSAHSQARPATEIRAQQSTEPTRIDGNTFILTPYDPDDPLAGCRALNARIERAIDRTAKDPATHAVLRIMCRFTWGRRSLAVSLVHLHRALVLEYRSSPNPPVPPAILDQPRKDNNANRHALVAMLKLLTPPILDLHFQESGSGHKAGYAILRKDFTPLGLAFAPVISCLRIIQTRRSPTPERSIAHPIGFLHKLAQDPVFSEDPEIPSPQECVRQAIGEGIVIPIRWKSSKTGKVETHYLLSKDWTSPGLPIGHPAATYGVEALPEFIPPEPERKEKDVGGGDSIFSERVASAGSRRPTLTTKHTSRDPATVFSDVITVLRRSERSGLTSPSRESVMQNVIGENIRALDKAGVTTEAQYLNAAATAGVITLSGDTVALAARGRR